MGYQLVPISMILNDRERP